MLDDYGYKNEIGIISTVIKQAAKDSEQDREIRKNADDNIAQQTEIDKNTSVNKLQEQQINELYSLIGQTPSSGTSVVYTVETDFKVEPGSDLASYSISYEATYNDKPVKPHKCTIKKYVNDEPGTVILDNTGVSGTTVTSNITGNKERYVLEVIPDNYIAFSTKVELTRYMCYVGSSNSNTMTADGLNSLQKYVSDGKKFQANENTFDGSYIWVVIPDSLNLEGVTSDSIAFSLNSDIQTVSNSLGAFKCYRNNKLLVSTNWNLIVFTSEN